MAEGDGEGGGTYGDGEAAWPTRQVPMKVDALPGWTGLDESVLERPPRSLAAAVGLPHLAVADGVGARVPPDRAAAAPRGSRRRRQPRRPPAALRGRAGAAAPPRRRRRLRLSRPDRRRGPRGGGLAGPAPASRRRSGSSGTSTRSAPPRRRSTILPALAPRCGLRALAERRGALPRARAARRRGTSTSARLSGKDRHELKRKIRKLERELPGTSVRSHDAAEGWDDALGRVPHASTASPRSARRASWTSAWSASSATRRARWRAAGWARLWFLDSEGGGGELSLPRVWRDRSGLYNSGFDPAHAQARARHRAPRPRDPATRSSAASPSSTSCAARSPTSRASGRRPRTSST